MATQFDISPFYRSSIGFDRLFNLLENANRLQAPKTWPPYDIIKTGDDSYRVVLAVPGFAEEELALTYEPNLLIASGARSEGEDTEYLHRGISAPKFEHRFELADHVRVAGARLEKGMLFVDLVREVPEAMKPRKITIGNDAGRPVEPAQIENRKAA